MKDNIKEITFKFALLLIILLIVLILSLWMIKCKNNTLTVVEEVKKEVPEKIKNKLPSQKAQTAKIIEKPKPKIKQEKKEIKKEKIVRDRFNIYTDNDAESNNFVPSGFMGDLRDVKIIENHLINPHSGKTCIEVTYFPYSSQGEGWAGVYWQHPANNWGIRRKGGFDLSGAKRVVFWARGEKGGEFVSEFKIGGIKGEFGDSDSVSIYNIELKKEWTKYIIDLSNIKLTRISGGFGWSANLANNPNGFKIYLDDIYYDYKK
ncbi:MAG: hypothetical protein ABII27_03795 [bacterium]